MQELQSTFYANILSPNIFETNDLAKDILGYMRLGQGSSTILGFMRKVTFNVNTKVIQCELLVQQCPDSPKSEIAP